MHSAWLYLMIFITGTGAASSDAGSIAAASSSDGHTQEYNLQKLILPIAGDRYLGADPKLAYVACDPNRTFSILVSKRFDFKLAGSEVERLGRFTHSRGFIANMHNQLDLNFHTRFPKLVRTMTYLADHGELAFDEGFYTVAAAVLRAHYLYARDKAVAMRRVESTPMLPANFSAHDAIDGIDTLPDAPMIGYFYNQFKANPPKAWAEPRKGHTLLLPDVDTIETISNALRPLSDMVYARVGPYAHLLRKGMSDWQQAKQELKQDIQTIQGSTCCSRWEKIAALRAMFYTDGKKYQIQAPLAQTHRPAEMINWNVTCNENSIEITPYYPVNGTLPALFAKKVFFALTKTVQNEYSRDPESKHLTEIIPWLSFDEIPPAEVLRLLNHAVVGKPLHEKETAVASIEIYLLRQIYDCLENKILQTLQSAAENNNIYMLDIQRILDCTIRHDCTEKHPRYCVTQRLLEALPFEYLYQLHTRCKNLLALAPAIDLQGDSAQAYYALRAAQEQERQNFDLYLYLYAYGDAPSRPTARWIHASPSIWHFMHLTQERQKEFLLRMWREHIKVPLEVDAFLAKYGCNESCSSTCFHLITIYRYLLSGTRSHDFHPDHVRMFRDPSKQENWLPEMHAELVVMRREILERMYPRYKQIMQELFNREQRLDMKMEQKGLVTYIKTLDRNGCSHMLNRLQHRDAQVADEAVRAAFEASLPLELRTYLLLSPERQQKTLCALRWRYYTLSLLSLVCSLIRSYSGR